MKTFARYLIGALVAGCLALLLWHAVQRRSTYTYRVLFRDRYVLEIKNVYACVTRKDYGDEYLVQCFTVDGDFFAVATDFQRQ